MGEFTVIPDRSMEVVKCWVPDLERDVVLPLRRSGVADAAIRALGGPARANDLEEFF